MKKMNQLLFLIIFLFVGVLCLVNIYLSQISFEQEGREYRVSMNRIEKALETYEASLDKPLTEEIVPEQVINIEDYPGITGIYAVEKMV